MRIPGQPYGDGIGKGEAAGATLPYKPWKIGLGRGESNSGVDSHAVWFENEEPLFLKIS